MGEKHVMDDVQIWITWRREERFTPAEIVEWPGRMLSSPEELFFTKSVLETEGYVGTDGVVGRGLCLHLQTSA
jgi:hypothetical protein